MNIFRNKKLNVLILGSDGMLGQDVFSELTQLSHIRGSAYGIITGLGRTEIDEYKITNQYGLSRFLDESIKYDWCINCIAHTDTKAAQETRSGYELSWTLNAVLPGFIAKTCICFGIKFIHISTDYVFSELSPSSGGERFFNPGDVPFPVNVYGMHKLAGEHAVSGVFSRKEKSYAILRTSWLYGMNGAKSFVHKFLKNAAQKHDMGEIIEMTVNETSVPASTGYVTGCIRDVMENTIFRGTLHAVPMTGYVPVSRLDFAKAILTEMNSAAAGTEFEEILPDTVQGVERNMLQPKFSAMESSFGRMMWRDDLHKFISANWKKLVETCGTH